MANRTPVTAQRAPRAANGRAPLALLPPIASTLERQVGVEVLEVCRESAAQSQRKASLFHQFQHLHAIGCRHDHELCRHNRRRARLFRSGGGQSRRGPYLCGRLLVRCRRGDLDTDDVGPTYRRCQPNTTFEQVVALSSGLFLRCGAISSTPAGRVDVYTGSNENGYVGREPAL